MYYIFENQVRPDGVVNTTTTGRSTFASALSHYYDRQSKLVMNEEFVSAHLMLTDERLKVEKQDDIQTLYKPAVEAPEEPAGE